MRVIEPRKMKARKAQQRKPVSRLTMGILILTPIVAIGAFAYITLFMPKNTDNNAISPTVESFEPPEQDPFDITEQPLKKLKGEEFRDLYRTVVYPNTSLSSAPPVITGDETVDQRIRKLAENRGYERTVNPEQAIIRVEDEPRLDDDDLLQPLAATAWTEMRRAAVADGYPISLLSAFRSVDQQREIFLNRLYGRISLDDLTNGNGDGAIEQTLELTAVPGYSRHHTGYTIDLWCEDGSASFVASSCYEWMKENGYINAMQHGWIPSYPEGTELQGPEPEPWEYVWVGDAVRER